MSENKPQKRPETGQRDALGRVVPGAPSLNPGGRPRKDDALREAEELLWDGTPTTARRLMQLTQSDDEKIAVAACGIHLKITIGVLERKSGKDGESLSPFAGLTNEEIKAYARDRLEREANATQLQVDTSDK